jgi:hypothetical protein
MPDLALHLRHLAERYDTDQLADTVDRDVLLRAAAIAERDLADEPAPAQP